MKSRMKLNEIKGPSIMKDLSRAKGCVKSGRYDRSGFTGPRVGSGNLFFSSLSAPRITCVGRDEEKSRLLFSSVFP